MNHRLLFCATLAALALCAAPALAVGPIACQWPAATIPANLAGVWDARQRDDGQEWIDIANPTFAADGTFTEVSTRGTLYGHWCVLDNVLIWGFDTETRTTYRVALGPQPMRGFMSWDGGGTGEVEIRR